MPFDERVCLRAMEMKKSGLAWRPQVGCFVWDPDEFIKPTSPFPGRIYFELPEYFTTKRKYAPRLDARNPVH